MISELPFDSPTERHWVFNEANGRNYMIKVPRDQPVITARLDWKPDRKSDSIRVGKYQFNLPALEAKGCIRTVGNQFQLRFLNLNQMIVLALNRASNQLPIGLISTGSSNPAPDRPTVRFSSETTIQEIADALNDRAPFYDVGQLQLIRKDLKSMKRLAPGPIFSKASVHQNAGYAFHSGGQGELQFNVGIETDSLRYGVAFSLETSQSLPDPKPLYEKIPYFNDYLAENPSVFEGLQMWEWHKERGKRSESRLPQRIGTESAKPGRFIFIGAITPLESVSVDEVLKVFDRLLNLYRYVESGGSVSAAQPPGSGISPAPEGGTRKTAISDSSWLSSFKPGHTPYPELATASFSERTIDVRLRHNYLQSLIYLLLVREFGKEHVGTELRSASGGEIDFAIRKEPKCILAELKISSLARSCIREAVGQLLEYGYLKEFNPPTELWVIGTGICTREDNAYLEVLRSKLGVPLFYRQFDEKRRKLGPRN